MEKDGLPPLREVIDSHGLNAKKKLGQNFILDLNLTRKIARTAGDLEGHLIVEVGPGPGGLTRAVLMEGGQNMLVIEKDERCLPALEDISLAYPGKLTIHQGDALEADLQAISEGKPLKIIANLPYNVATPLLTNWLIRQYQSSYLSSLTLMFQKEVAERIVASPGQKSFGRLSVLCQFVCDCQLAFKVSRSAFIPPPKVESAIVHLVPHSNAGSSSLFPGIDIKTLEKVTAAAFGQRRKMLRASLKQILPDPETQLKKLDIDPTLRAENLTVQQFCAISERVMD